MAAAADLAVRPGLAPCAWNAEFELLLAGCGKKVEESELTAIFHPRLNWDRVLHLANHHRVLPALFSFLQGRRDLPSSIQCTLRARFQMHAQQVLRLSAELTGILRKLQSLRIEGLAHKGPVLAERLYRDPAMRQFGDLDFLVRAADLARARTALQELGYTPNLRLSARQEEAYLRSGYEHVFGCDAGRNLVELQWQVVPRFYAVDFDMDSLFSRSVEVNFEGERVQMLRNEDLLLVSCVHAAKHGWEHLGMVRDIAMLGSFGLDWNWIEREAGRLGILRILLISLLLARNLLGCEFSQISYSDSEMLFCEQLARAFALMLASGKATHAESLSYFRTMMRVRERWRDRARFAWRLAVTPSIGEWKVLAIPDSLFPVYQGVRAMRLLRRLCA